MKRVRQHIIIVSVSTIFLLGVYYGLNSKSVMFRLSMSSAYVSLVLFGASLIIGPWNILRNLPNPVSTHLRRDIGIWAALIGLAHVVVGLQVHMRGKMWTYFIFPRDKWSVFPFRYDPFGIANYTGLVSGLILLMLLALSNNVSLRKFGRSRWKYLQRWSYLGFALMAVHSIAYQFIEKRDLLFVGLFSLIVLSVIIMQVRGFRKVRAYPQFNKAQK